MCFIISENSTLILGLSAPLVLYSDAASPYFLIFVSILFINSLLFDNFCLVLTPLANDWILVAAPSVFIFLTFSDAAFHLIASPKIDVAISLLGFGWPVNSVLYHYIQIHVLVFLNVLVLLIY